MAISQEKSNQVWPGTNTRLWHVHDGPVCWISTGLGLWECVGCRGNSCSWYSAMWMIFMVNYQVMLQEQFDQMALILVDVCESYWPLYTCPVLGGGTQCTYNSCVVHCKILPGALFWHEIVDLKTECTQYNFQKSLMMPAIKPAFSYWRKQMLSHSRTAQLEDSVCTAL